MTPFVVVLQPTHTSATSQGLRGVRVSGTTPKRVARLQSDASPPPPQPWRPAAVAGAQRQSAQVNPNSPQALSRALYPRDAPFPTQAHTCMGARHPYAGAPARRQTQRAPWLPPRSPWRQASSSTGGGAVRSPAHAKRSERRTAAPVRGAPPAHQPRGCPGAGRAGQWRNHDQERRRQKARCESGRVRRTHHTQVRECLGSWGCW